ncbi:MAG TPA: hypothetical protein VK824_03160 [Planctomycetota bacterium]|nr:hypothetical protein [Planctomycetota bacterium]
MKSIAALVLALTASAPAVAAQFTLFPWTLDDAQGGIASVSATDMGLFGLFLQSGGVIQYTTTSPVAGHVIVNALVQPEDGVCTTGGQPVSTAAYIVDGQLVPFATCTFSNALSFDVVENEPFGFALKATDPSWPFATSYSHFRFTPYWEALGGALAGSAGLPSLAGLGVLQPGQPMGLALQGAAPGAATALIVGTGTANLPFKGGVLVPTPDVIVQGLATDGAGELNLSATWPAGITVPVIIQAWIADAGGVQGFSASNAVTTVVIG